ncbi:MAG: COX15/CtaA family protein [Burkholderiales bacterium]|nr:COX15/CtaA family protein [Burkholderiales bacterium]
MLAAAHDLVDFSPALRLALLAVVVALLPLSWWWLRHGGVDRRARAAALTALTMFLTFDLVVFGSFTRLTDSGLGCPDWPGCYGQASPFGAAGDIHAAETALPSGPVTQTKAWIEMIHRYLAMTVGVLILVLAAAAWFDRRRGTASPVSPWWPTATLAWVVVQGLFGKYTVTLKLYPAIVTLHLLGGLLLLVLLAAQHVTFRPRPLAAAVPLRRLLALAALLLLVQVTLGGWVSTNYAVLACSDFPRCNGDLWPTMDFGAGFAVLRPLGKDSGGGFLAFEALVAIHMAHRLFALAAVAALLALSLGLWRAGGTTNRRFAAGIAALTLAQVATGLSNIVLDWPIGAALLHAAGAAALVLLLAFLGMRMRQALQPAVAPGPLTAAA